MYRRNVDEFNRAAREHTLKHAIDNVITRPVATGPVTARPGDTLATGFEANISASSRRCEKTVEDGDDSDGSESESGSSCSEEELTSESDSGGATRVHKRVLDMSSGKSDSVNKRLRADVEN